MCAPIPKDKWSWKFSCCLKCGTTKKTGKFIHKGNGICHSCWDKERDKNPNRLAIKKKAHDKWYSKVKKTEKDLKYSRERAKIWVKNSHHLYKKAYRKANIKKKWKKFLAGKLRIMQRNENGLQFRCEGCLKECLIKSFIKPYKMVESERNDNLYWLEIFKEVVIEECKNKILCGGN